MANNRISIVAMLTLFALASCKTPTPLTVKHVTQLEAGHSLQGFYYSLPRSVVSVDISILKTEEIPGPFAQYASRFLSIDNVILTSTTHHSIYDVSINTYAEPDPSEYYFVEFDPSRHKNSPFSMVLSEGGIISAINHPFDTQEFLRKAPSRNMYGYYGSEATFNHFMEFNLQERVDTILERVRMDTVTVERKTLRRTWVEKTSEVRAREVAEYILRIRNKRFELVSGFAEIPYSKETLQYMNDQLAKLEADYLELFTGISTQSIVKYRYSYVPEKNESGREVNLFYFNERTGITSEPDIRSEAIKLKVTRDFSTRQMGVFTINPTGRKSLDRGIFYRIPEHATITITRDEKPISEARQLISQFGVVTSLPPDNLKIEFYPNTGTIKSVEKME